MKVARLTRPDEEAGDKAVERGADTVDYGIEHRREEADAVPQGQPVGLLRPLLGREPEGALGGHQHLEGPLQADARDG